MLYWLRSVFQRDSRSRCQTDDHDSFPFDVDTSEFMPLERRKQTQWRLGKDRLQQEPGVHQSCYQQGQQWQQQWQQHQQKQQQRKVFPEDEPEGMSSSTKTTVLAGANFLCFAAIAVWAYAFQFERWGIVDSLYFAVCTFTRIGYGDLTPTSDASRIFTCFFALYGISILGFYINMIGERLVGLHQQAVADVEHRAKLRVTSMFDDDDLHQSADWAGGEGKGRPTEEHKGEQRNAENLAKNSALFVIAKAFVEEVPIIAVILGVGILMGKLEGWTVVEGIYFGVATASTVGYGDLTPEKEYLKATAAIVLPLMVGVFCELLSRVAGAYLKFKVAQQETQLLDKKFTVDDLINMDTDSDGSVSYGEFLSFMLMAMHKVEEDDLVKLKSIFDRLDRSGDGILDKDDLLRPSSSQHNHRRYS